MSSVGASTSSNFWTSLEYNRNNAWYVNFGNGNFNNNNKFNTYTVRPVAALSEETLKSWVEAYEDCCTHKMSSEQCVLYRIISCRDLVTLAAEVEQRIYTPSTSIRFYVTRPRLREVFAANFRDRIAQHWVCIRLIPLIEERFRQMGDISFNCRPGFGVQAAVSALAAKIEEVSANYTQEAWIIKLDMKAFFMTIDRRILWKFLKPFIIEHYKGDDIDTLLWLTWTILRHHPQLDCVLKGVDYKDVIDPEKSLLFAELFIGSPIGNITSQILANFLLTFMDAIMLEYCKQHQGECIRFMDDIMAVFKTKAAALEFRKMLMEWAPEHLHQQLHPDKVYIQPAKHGVKAIGYVIKPGRIYLSNNIVGHIHESMANADKLCASIIKEGINIDNASQLDRLICGLNSHFGFLHHAASHNILMKLFATVPNFWQVCYVKAPHTVKIRKQYQVITLLNKQENDYNKIKTSESGALSQHLQAKRNHATHRAYRSRRQH